MTSLLKTVVSSDNVKVMSTRDEFFKNFNFISQSFSENIAVYYVSDFKDSLGISYFELDKVSNDLSQFFSKIFGTNSLYVGVWLSDNLFLPCIILGIWKNGFCFAGIPNQYYKRDIANFLYFFRIRYFITDSKDQKFYEFYKLNLISQFFICERKFFIWEMQFKDEIHLDGLNDICYGIMTSGSTGEPKVIQVPWSCILANAAELLEEFQVTEFDCIFQASPCCFDPFFIELFMVFLKGCSLLVVSNARKLCSTDLLKTLLYPTEENHLRLPSLNSDFSTRENYFHVNIQQVHVKHITILQMTPSVFKRWTDNEIKDHILSSNSPLRILILGGEKFPREILKLKCTGNNTRIFNIYGITEISCWAFLNELTNSPPDAEISIGKPLKDIVYKISKKGELEIGSDTRICFINKESFCEIKSTVFRKTGDIVKFDNKEIYYLNRNTQSVKIYGIRVNLSKIEYLFMHKNKSFRECHCVFNEKNLKLGLFYLPDNSKATDEMKYELKTYEEFNKNYETPDLKDIEKPDYLIEISKTPLNSNGKCDRKELLQYLEDIWIPGEGKDVKAIFEHLWVDILGIRKTDLLSSSFIESGGNSILGLKFLCNLEDEGVRPPSNFITHLLSGKSYLECLECLEEFQVPRKRHKFDIDISDVKLRVKWKFDLGKCVDASPAVFSFQGEERLVIGSHSFKLSCINPESGHEIWTIFLGDRIESGFRPTKDGSKGYIGCYDHYVYCIRTSDGSILWKFKTEDVVKSTPCLSTNEKTLFVGSYDKKLYCLSAVEGQVENSFKLSNGAIYSSGIISDALSSFYIGTLDGSCVAINQKTNEPTWKTILESPVFASPCLVPDKNEILFSEVLGYVHCLNALNGMKLWTFKADGNIYSSPVIEEISETTLIIFGCHDAHLYCLEYEKLAMKLNIMWKQQLGSSIFTRPSIAFDKSLVCATTTKGYVCLCDLLSGSTKTILNLEEEVFSSPVYRSNRLFVGCRDNYVYSLEIFDMKIDSKFS